MRDNTTTDRGQAYTLEGFISAMIVLMALLFALQSVVITPTTGGLADRTVEAQMQQETQDALMIAATAEEDGDLSKLIRHWDPDEDEDQAEFYEARDSGDGHYEPNQDSRFYQQFVLGEIMVDRFTESGMSYNIELVAQDENGEFDGDSSTYLVYQGQSESITASYTVTLSEDDTLTIPENGEEENSDKTVREAYEDFNYPIPPAHEDDEDNPEVYNVVEVRISIW